MRTFFSNVPKMEKSMEVTLDNGRGCGTGQKQRLNDNISVSLEALAQLICPDFKVAMGS